MNKELHFSSKSEEWYTPQDLFDRLDSIYHFTLDAAASEENSKCEHYYTKEDDALNKPWQGTVWLNPPYGRGIGEWIKKAYQSASEGATVVCLLPARTDTAAFHRYILPFSGINSSRLDYAWAAGIIDGEGCVFIRKTNVTERSKNKSPYYDMRIKITMTDYPTIYKFKDIFKCGFLIEEKRTNHWKDALSVVFSAAEAYKVLQLTYPYLVTKQYQAQMAMEFQALKIDKKGNEALYQIYYENMRKDKTLLIP